MRIPEVLEELLSLPTAPFVEQAVLEHLERAVAQLRNTDYRFDEHGNLLVHYKHRDSGPAPVCLTAHTDHPGFVALEMTDEDTLLASFRGWVEPEYFEDEKVRFWCDGRWIKGRIREVVKTAPIYGMIGRTGRPEQVAIRVKEPVAPQSPGMWNLPDPELDDGLVYARGCDDLAGAAALLAMFQRLSCAGAPAEVYGLFTRAEEVGFVGAIGAARSGTIPKGTPIIAIETSKEIPGVRMGQGPVLRVGDKTSIFTPHVTAYADRVAKALLQPAPVDGQAGQPARGGKSRTSAAERGAAAAGAARQRKPGPNKAAGNGSSGGSQNGAAFRYQRKLMDGGTCESTAYLAYGYPATGICLALGNYHNMNEKRGRIDSEYISLADWHWMVDWFEALARDEQGVGKEAAALRENLDKRFAEYEGLLRERTAAMS